MTIRAATLDRHVPLHAVVLVAGLAALTLRPIGDASVLILLAVGAAAIAGMRALTVPARPASMRWAIGAGMLGAVAFVVVRLSGEGFSVRATTFGIAGLVLAGICEEAFFRGYLDALLRRAGLAAVMVGAITAMAFAMIHLPLYGTWVLPIDLAAGAVLAWQREASGTWIVPAFTHAAANLLQLG